MRKVLIILAVLATPQFVVQATQERGYFTPGGEWLIAPLVFLIIYGLIPLMIQFTKECLKSGQDFKH